MFNSHFIAKNLRIRYEVLSLLQVLTTKKTSALNLQTEEILELGFADKFVEMFKEKKNSLNPVQSLLNPRKSCTTLIYMEMRLTTRQSHIGLPTLKSYLLQQMLI